MSRRARRCERGSTTTRGSLISGVTIRSGSSSGAYRNARSARRLRRAENVSVNSNARTSIRTSGCRALKRRQDGGEQSTRRGPERADRRASCRLATSERPGVRERPVGSGEDRSSLAVSSASPAGVSVTCRVVRSQQQPADLALELTDLGRQRRLREMQASRRAREVQLLGDGHEVAQLAQVHGAFNLSRRAHNLANVAVAIKGHSEEHLSPWKSVDGSGSRSAASPFGAGVPTARSCSTTGGRSTIATRDISPRSSRRRSSPST